METTSLLRAAKTRDKYIITLCMTEIIDLIDPSFQFAQTPEEQLALAKYYKDMLSDPQITKPTRESIKLNLSAWVSSLLLFIRGRKLTD